MRQDRWPSSFPLTEEQFVQHLRTRIREDGVKIRWQIKLKILAVLSAAASVYTDNPTKRERDDVAEQLCRLFPILETDIGFGHHAWEGEICNKMRENRRSNYYIFFVA